MKDNVARGVYKWTIDKPLPKTNGIPMTEWTVKAGLDDLDPFHRAIQRRRKRLAKEAQCHK